MPASSGGIGLMTPRPHLQLLLVWQLQSPPSYGQTMPGIVHIADLSGTVAGQSEGLQHDHMELAHSQVRPPYGQDPSPFWHSLPSAGSAGGQY
jgi:hypothetical protein